ncbi:hypothetical protein HYFRA_00009866 [Hymenoscyphus fraxineus]|uniref:Uncharacterized protein n=1 Tax=Hymenoscyphus fraxineus TaxID=746836 RepID=A0A9N9PWQ5_9HELO|nr:hypothetical protein HYFRA_00009866 [Hymenoscyphus fraxineus]
MTIRADSFPNQNVEFDSAPLLELATSKTTENGIVFYITDDGYERRTTNAPCMPSGMSMLLGPSCVVVHRQSLQIAKGHDNNMVKYCLELSSAGALREFQEASC